MQWFCNWKGWPKNDVSRIHVTVRTKPEWKYFEASFSISKGKFSNRFIKSVSVQKYTKTSPCFFCICLVANTICRTWYFDIYSLRLLICMVYATFEHTYPWNKQNLKTMICDSACSQHNSSVIANFQYLDFLFFFNFLSNFSAVLCVFSLCSTKKS